MSGWTGSYVPVPGDVIALKRGVEWRQTGQWVIGQSGSSTGQIVYTAYGTGAKPKYTVLEDNSSGWTLFSGSVYRHAVNTATGDVKRLFIDGVGMGQAWATSTNTALDNWVGKTNVVTVANDPDPGTGPNAENGTVHDTGIIRYWAQITDSGGTKWLYLYSPGGVPGASGQKIEVVKSGIDSVVVLTNRSYVTFDNIALSGGVTAAVNIGISDPYESIGLQVTNCAITCTRGEGIRVWSTSTVTAKNGLIKWNTLNSSAGLSCKPVPDDFPAGTQPYGFKVYPSPDGDGGWENGITLYNGCENWTVAQNDVSNFWHTQISVLLRALNMAGLINNCVEHNDLHAENINYAHGIEVVCATGSSPNESAQMERLNGNILRYNKVHDTWVNDKNEGKNTKVYGNLIYKVKGSPRESTDNTSWGADGFVMKGHDSLVTGGVFAYNTIVDVAGPGLTLMANRGGIPTNATVANNIFYNCGTRTKTGGTVRGVIIQDLYWNVTSTDFLQVDNNCLFDPSFTLVYEKGSGGGSATFYDVPGMEAQQTQQTPSPWNFNRQENPGFTNYANGDFTLLSTSSERGQAKDITSLIPESAGWTNLGCWQDAAATPATTFVSAQALSSNNWNDYTGWKGMKITVGSTPMIVTDLGRWVVSGNSQTHTLKIVNASGTTVASTSVALSGAPSAQYKYAALAAPVTLAASSVYYIVSSETNLGDYLVGSGTVLTHTGAATVNNAVRSTDSVSFTSEGTTDNCSGPLNFKYYLETNFVTGQTLSSTSWNDYTGWKGMKITVGSAPIIVTQLGRWVLSGNAQAHTVKIVDNAGTTVGSVSVATSGAPTAQMKYVALSTPVVLSAGSVYYIVSQETNGGDFIWGSGTVLSHTSAAAINNAVRSPDGVTFSNDGTTDNCSGPVAFKYY